MVRLQIGPRSWEESFHPVVVLRVLLYYLLLAQDVREASDPLWETGSVKGVASARVLGWSKFFPVSHLQGSSLKKQKQSMLGNNCKFVFVSLSCVYPQYFLICSLYWAKARWDRGGGKKLKMLSSSHGIALMHSSFVNPSDSQVWRAVFLVHGLTMFFK